MFYGPELARVHDAGFGALALAAAGTAADLLAAAGIHSGLVVDLGCGTGIGAELLIAAGYDVLGVDLSADQLAIARRRAPTALFEQASLFDFTPPRCVAVTVAGEGLCYTADERAGRDATREVFERAYASLEPGGVLLFDVLTSGRAGTEPRRSWWEGHGWLICVETQEQPDARALRRSMTTFVRDERGGWARSDEEHTQVVLDPDEIAADLSAAGFSDVRRLDGYGSDFEFGPGHAGFAATRR